jgi:hypothetical protein
MPSKNFDQLYYMYGKNNLFFDDICFVLDQ